MPKRVIGPVVARFDAAPKGSPIAHAVGKTGVLVVDESTRKYPGKHFATLFYSSTSTGPTSDGKFDTDKFAMTSCCDMTADGDTIRLVSRRGGSYVFVITNGVAAPALNPSESRSRVSADDNRATLKSDDQWLRVAHVDCAARWSDRLIEAQGIACPVEEEDDLGDGYVTLVRRVWPTDSDSFENAMDQLDRMLHLDRRNDYRNAKKRFSIQLVYDLR